MKMNNGLRDLLEGMTTAELDAMLQAELQKRPLDAAAVNLIMEILKERDTGEPVELNREIQGAWKEYNDSTQTSSASRHPWSGMLLRVASVLLVVGVLLFTIPQEAGAKSLWDWFLHVTDSIFELFDSGDDGSHRVEYEFVTDNPGLQQVYDVVIELGVTEPVVPMWLPEGYELLELKTKHYPGKTKVHARFESLGSGMIYTIVIFDKPITHNYLKDDTQIMKYERGGIIHNVLQNNDMLVAIWTRDNVECSLGTICQEETLYEILKSIYVMGDEN